MKKTKDPAFLLYSSDFLIDCAEMTHEEVGQYFRILCYMHQKGRLNEQTICRLVGSILPQVKLKFRITDDGMWYNESLEKEIAQRQAFAESRRQNARRHGKKKENKELCDNSSSLNNNSSSFNDNSSSFNDNSSFSESPSFDASAEASAEAKEEHMENENVNENKNEILNEIEFSEGGGRGEKGKKPVRPNRSFMQGASQLRVVLRFVR